MKMKSVRSYHLCDLFAGSIETNKPFTVDASHLEQVLISIGKTDPRSNRYVEYATLHFEIKWEEDKAILVFR